jgi:hypothetical protein
MNVKMLNSKKNNDESSIVFCSTQKKVKINRKTAFNAIIASEGKRRRNMNILG